MDMHIKNIINSLIYSLNNNLPLTQPEYSQLLSLSEDDLNTVINNLDDDDGNEYSFFDLTVPQYIGQNFIDMTDDDRNIEIEDFPILLFALRNQNTIFATYLVNSLYEPQNDYEYTLPIVSSLDPFGQTSLHISVWLNEYHMSDRLIQLGADVNSLNTNGHSPLIESDGTCNEGERVVNLLYQHGGRYIAEDQTWKTSTDEINNRSDQFPNVVIPLQSNSSNEELSPVELQEWTDSNVISFLASQQSSNTWGSE